VPMQRIDRHLRRSEDFLVSAASFEVGLKEFPLKAIISGGVLNGSPTVDFVGIGTSVSMAKKAIKFEMKEPEIER